MNTDQQQPLRTDLVRMIIHEIRNPLTTISLANETLRLQGTDNPVLPVAEPMTEIIRRNVQQIEALMKNLLDLEEEPEPQLIPTNICHIIENSLGKLADRLLLNRIEVIKSYCPVLLIKGDANKLSLAFLNILVNAIEAIKKRSGKIWITTYQAQDKIRVVFKDNGVGMEPAVAERIFEKKFSSKSDGLGIGLTHVKEILDWHQATIAVNSIPGVGTSLVLTFDCM